MGYYMAMGRTPDMKPIGRQELWDFIEKKPWSFVMNNRKHRPYFCFQYGNDVMFDCGIMSVVETPPSDGSLQAPWLSIRLSWATGKKFPEVVKFLLELGDELGMVLFSNDDTLVTYENIDVVMMEYFGDAKFVSELLGQIVIPKTAKEE